MIAVLHLGQFDGAEFDMRPWDRVPEFVHCREGGNGKLGIALSQRRRPGSVRYRYVNATADGIYHYLLHDDESSGLEIPTSIPAPTEFVEAA